jgi:major membrane immunogen (membrane-anchored lipoprotein)
MKNLKALLIVALVASSFSVMSEETFTCNSDTEYSSGKTEFVVADDAEIISLTVYEGGMPSYTSKYPNKKSAWWSYDGTTNFKHRLDDDWRVCVRGSSDRDVQKERHLQEINDY